MNEIPDKSNNPIAFFSSSYEICVWGRISRQGAVWFEDMTLSVNTETTPPQTIIVSGPIDQATLYGLINRIRDLGLTLISIKPINQMNEKGD